MKSILRIGLSLSIAVSLQAYERKCVDITLAQNEKDVKDLNKQNHPASYFYIERPSSFFTTTDSEVHAEQAKFQGLKRACYVFVSINEINAVQLELANFDDNANLMVLPLSGVARSMADDLLQQNQDLTVGSLRRLLATAEANSN